MRLQLIEDEKKVASVVACGLRAESFGVDVVQARNRELGGAGIGLSVVHAICVACNGRVAVESTEGSGSCFRVSLPLPKK